jgi:hypothetical protein
MPALPSALVTSNSRPGAFSMDITICFKFIGSSSLIRTCVVKDFLVDFNDRSEILFGKGANVNI